MANTDKNTNDFFSLLEQEQKAENPLAADEILFRDEKGKLKALRDGKVLDFADQLVERKKKPDFDSSVPQDRAKKPVAQLPKRQLALDRNIEAIIGRSKVHFTNQQAKDRFRRIILSRLKDIRTQAEVRAVFLAPFSAGGMEFSQQDTERILSIIGWEFEQLDSRLRDKVSKEPFADLQREPKRILNQPPPLVFKSRSDLPEEKSAEALAVERPAALIKEEPKIEDVKFEPQLTGPVEEIKSMSVDDFRQLAPTPAQAVKKIIAKVDLLEQDSFTKRIQGIRAWKESEVCRLYLELGNQSMAEKKSISEVIIERQKRNQPTLTEEEFEAVMELNRKLRY